MALRDTLHFPFFIVLLALIYAALLRIRSNPRKRALLQAIVLTSAIGGASEWAQTLTSRTASGQDLLMNLLGVACGSATIAGGWLRGSRRSFLWLIPVVAIWVGSTFLVTRPAIRALKAERHQAGAFPRLGDFEDEWETVVWTPQGDDGAGPTRATFSNAHPTHGRQSLKIDIHGSNWAGVRLLIGKRLPWPESRSLRFDVYNPGDEFELGIRVDGFEGGRFTGKVAIAPGLNQCRIPPDELADRGRELTRPASFAARIIVFHLGESPSTRSFYLDNVKVE